MEELRLKIAAQDFFSVNLDKRLKAPVCIIMSNFLFLGKSEKNPELFCFRVMAHNGFLPIDAWYSLSIDIKLYSS